MNPSPPSTPHASKRYVTAGRVAQAFNAVVAWLIRRGLNVKGSRILEIRGRTSGEPRQTPVNVLRVDGREYLVAPRGQTQWVRNLRVAEEGTLRKGKQTTSFTATELSDDAKAPILRAYIDEWWFEVSAFFDGVDRDATPAQLARIAPGFPVFQLQDQVVQ